MSREIKFRGMTLGGDWVYGLLSYMPKKHEHIQPGYYISNKAGMPFAYAVRPETIGQYTGLKDKDDREIYEGDILINVNVQNSDYVTKPFIVEWGDEENYCGFVARTVNNNIGELFLNKNFINCEIIGNIHADKHLLEAAE